MGVHQVGDRARHSVRAGDGLDRAQQVVADGGRCVDEYHAVAGGQVFAASDGGEQSLFQLGAPFGGDDGSPTEMHQHHHGCRGARLRQLLERPRHFSQAATRAAVFDGDKQAQHSAAPEGRDVFAREAAFAIHLFGIARDDFLRRLGVLGHQLFGLGHKRLTPYPYWFAGRNGALHQKVRHH